MEDWPFDQPRNCATFTLRQIMAGLQPVLLVSHDEEDHGWQFLTGEQIDLANAMVVCLEEVVLTDDTLLGIADLPPGWQAMRDSQGSPWQRSRSERLANADDES